MSKKICVLAFAALLVVAFAGSSLAATKFTFQGTYMVRSFLDTNPTLNDDDSGDGSYAWFDHDLCMSTKFQVSKRLWLTVDVRALGENIWGTTTSYKSWGGAGDGVDAAWVTGLGNRAQGNISAPEIEKAYMNIMTGFGLFRVGRMTGGAAGLILFGHGQGPVGYTFAPFDNSQPRDRIWWNSMGMFGKQFSMLAVYEKKLENTAWNGNAAGRGTSTQDYDGYFVLLNYKWKNGGVNTVLGKYVLNTANATATDNKIHIYLVNPSLHLVFGGFQLNFEMLYLPGEVDFAPWLEALGAEDIDIDQLGYYADVQYNYGAGNVGLMYMFNPGDDPTTADEWETIMGAGDQFTPLYHAFSTYTDYNLNDGVNYAAVVLWWDHTLTENLMMHAAYGWIKRDQRVYAVALDESDEYGSEFDFGLVYQVMENLEYQVHFAYFMPGDWFKALKANAAGAATTDGIEVDNTIQIDNTLTLAF
ncbi:MAG: hypothetical protein SV487_03310 [Thermodesulfobacteriota bacterium]|nr:hypothetical protein [Thermodesulfobacteriota bacterium]